MSGQNNWMYSTPFNVPAPGANVQANGGGMTNIIGFRDIADARRTMISSHIPQAEYPDGYLGTIVSRRSDRLLQAAQNKVTQRQYQRGVHKGERIDPRDYYWTNEVNPEAGLAAQARGEKWTQTGSPVEILAHMGKTAGMQKTPEQMAAIYAQYGISDANIGPPAGARLAQNAHLQGLMPRWH